MKVGLVLGAGGVLGGAWLTSGLNAIARETEWDPGSAEYIVGTSAGAMTGVLLAAGVPPWFMVAPSNRRVFNGLTGPDGRPAADAHRAAGADFRLHRGLPHLGPGSLRMAATALANPLRHTPLQMLAGWLPAGLISTDPLVATVRRAVRERWVDHPNFWAVACDYQSGRRTPFGRLDMPQVDVADAVAASCAIPGFYRPVRIGRRRYVDGGVCSASNLDLVAGRGLDLVICMNPLSGRAERTTLDPLEWLPVMGRRANRRRLRHEERKVRRFGTKVVIIEPTPGDHAVMGLNWMSTERRREVIETAERTVTEQLRRPELREALSGLPKGPAHRIRQPPGPPETWPRFTAEGRRG
jgi:NTE family protein